VTFNDIQTPRSTSPTDSFRLATFNGLGEQLDIQTEGIVVVLDSPSDIPQGFITSSSQVVAEEGQTWEVEFTSL
jgi:uncharacterized protein YlxW (UPF0749 family)